MSPAQEEKPAKLLLKEVEEVVEEAVVAEEATEAAVVDTEGVVMAAAVVDEETIVDMKIAVEVIAIVQEIGTGDTVVGMTKCIKSWLFVCTTSEVII